MSIMQYNPTPAPRNTLANPVPALGYWPSDAKKQAAAQQLKDAQNVTAQNTYSYGYNPAVGGIPSVPNPGVSQQQSTDANLAALPGLQNLGNQVNAYQQNALQNQYALMNPNFASSFNQAGQNVGNQLRGYLSPDAINSMAQSLAEAGVADGTSGSPIAISTAAMRYLRGSMGEQQQGLTNLLNLTQGTPIATPYNVQQGFVTPSYMQEQQMYANTLASAPNPAHAYDLQMANARRGINQGSSQYGGNQQGSDGGGQSVADIVKSIIAAGKSSSSSGGASDKGPPGSGGYSTPSTPGYTVPGFTPPDNWNELSQEEKTQYGNLYRSAHEGAGAAARNATYE